ncbi:MAG: IclR family transcriptional regulator C-terminal domain-containing protein [Lysinibacillus sp.]
MLSDKDLNHFLEQTLPAFSQYTITDPEKLRIELDKVRKEMVGTSIGEFDESENAISAPIFDKKQNVVAFITLGAPSFRLPKESLLLLRERMLAAAKAIEDQL